MKRMRNVNLALDEISKRRPHKLLNSSSLVDSSNVLPGKLNQQRRSADAMELQSWRSQQRGTAPTARRATSERGPAHSFDVTNAPGPSLRGKAQPARREPASTVIQSRVSIASLMKDRAALGAMPPQPDPRERPRPAQHPKPKPARRKGRGDRQRAQLQAGMSRRSAMQPGSGATVKRGKPAPKRRLAQAVGGSGQSLQDKGLSPWDGVPMNESVSTLLATLDRKLTQDHALGPRQRTAKAQRNRPRDSSPGLRAASAQSVAAGGSNGSWPAAERAAARGPDACTKKQRAEAAAELLYTCSPEDLARRLYPDDASASSTHQSAAHSRAGSRTAEQLAHSDTPPDSGHNSQLVARSKSAPQQSFQQGSPSQPRDPGQPLADSGHRAACISNAASDSLRPALETVDSDEELQMLDKRVGEALAGSNHGSNCQGGSAVCDPLRSHGSVDCSASESQLLASSILGDHRGALSTLLLSEVIAEVAAGTVMDKRKDSLAESQRQPDRHGKGIGALLRRLAGSSRAPTGSRPVNLRPGSRRRVQLILDSGSAVIAYGRGAYRGTNHGYLQSVQAKGGSWQRGDEISATTSTFVFHLIPLAAREYYLWLLALNAALHYIDGLPLDRDATAVDLPLHRQLKTGMPIMSLALWASDGASQ